MSEAKSSRRRFLADLLFLGGGLSAIALLAQSGPSDPMVSSPTPQAPVDPVHNPVSPGEMVAPVTNEPPPVLDGDVALPSDPPPKCVKDADQSHPAPAGKPMPIVAPKNTRRS